MADFIAYLFVQVVSGFIWTLLFVFGLLLVRALLWMFQGRVVRKEVK